MSNKRKLNPDKESYNNSKRRKLNPDNERRKLNPDSVIEMKNRQATYYKTYNNNYSKEDNYIEINHCKEAIQMAVDIALKKTGGKINKNKKTNKNNKRKKTNKRRTNKIW